MGITIHSSAGSRTGVIPFEGIADEVALIKSLILSLAVERGHGVDDVTLTVDCSKVDANRLVAIAKMFGQMQAEKKCLDTAVH